MRIYIAGKVTGDLNYKAKFAEAENKLKAMGHIVMNPAILPDGLGGYEEYMPICFAMINACDAIYLLSDWDKSKGAKEELDYGTSKGKIVFKEAEI